MPFAADIQLGPYKIISLIGAGGMGEVYRAQDTRLLRDVALKVLQESFTADPDRLRRFEQEARAVAALNHPNIVSVFDVGVSDKVHYIVTELIEGETLRQRIPPQGMATRKAVELSVQLANGLAAAHDQGIAHRDLKPENILITKDGRLKILDFGLAKLRRSHAQTETVDGMTGAETSAGMVLGTVGYMSPEQVRGEPADQLSDIFSYGSILYEIISRLTILSARFTPDGNLIYGASLEGKPAELFFAQQGSVESRPIGMLSTSILAVAPNGELAVQSNPALTASFAYTGTLARAPQT